MAQIKTSELTDAALDWAVAKCEGHEIDSLMRGAVWYLVKCSLTDEPEVVKIFAPSTNWTQGGPIIEREGMNLSTVDALNGPFWVAHMPYGMSEDFAEGPTPLIAAMRCYVTSKLGDVIEVPDALMNKGEL